MPIQKTWVAKPAEVKQEWWIVDGSEKVVGRLASDIATVLMGKHRPTYTAHVDTGDFVIVTNVEKVKFTGNKWENKVYTRYSGWPGLKSETAKQRLGKAPERILREAVRRMLPKSKLGRAMLKKLKLVVGPDHEHQAQNPQTANFGESK